MGFLRRLFGGAKNSDHSSGKDNNKKKKKWSFGKKSNNHKSHSSKPQGFDSSTTFSDSLDANKHAIAVAAATAAVAEAALAAAHAAAEVVRLTSGPAVARPVSPAPATASHRRWVEEAAAVKIQSSFRSYLARRALRALKALVKLQALVRGHIVRKQTADMLRRMQTLVRLQARARASRAHMSVESDHPYSSKSSLFYHPVPEDHEHPLRGYSTKFDGSSILKRCSSNANFREIGPQRAQFGSKWLDRWMEESVWSHPRDVPLRNVGADDEKSAKILEVDTWKPHFRSHRSSSSFHAASQYYLTSDYFNSEIAYDSPLKSSAKALNQSLSSLTSLKIQKGKEAVSASRNAENSPQALSAASSRPGSGGGRRGPFTPTRSECSWGFFGYPNYMANTESSRAKVRSQSAPKQRLEFDRCSSSGRSVQGLWDYSDRDGDFRNRAYPASTRLNRVGSTNLR